MSDEHERESEREDARGDGPDYEDPWGDVQEHERERERAYEHAHERELEHDEHDHEDHSLDFTVVNLKQVEDQAQKFGYAPYMESRFARVPLRLAASGLSYFRIAPNYRVPFGHFHTEQEEIYVVLAGNVRARVGHEIVELGPFDALRVTPMVTRNLEGGPDGAELLVFGSPSHDNRDAEVLRGWWTD